MELIYPNSRQRVVQIRRKWYVKQYIFYGELKIFFLMYTKIPMELIKYQNWSSDNLFWGDSLQSFCCPVQKAFEL